ncbi:phosphonate C-P lyase system protein PhnH [Guggenheimella bovis]
MNDFVFTTQSTFRKLIDALSHPGKLIHLEKEASELQIETQMNSLFLLFARTFLDLEVTFYYPFEEASFISSLTYSKSISCEEADFLFLPLEDESRDESLKKAKIGTLMYPNKGATVVYEVDELFLEGDIELSGPGIEKKASFGLGPSDRNWIPIRNLLTSEFPLGIDLILIDGSGRALAIPRTTHMEV